jgi:hypothetical protein
LYAKPLFISSKKLQTMKKITHAKTGKNSNQILFRFSRGGQIEFLTKISS